MVWVQQFTVQACRFAVFEEFYKGEVKIVMPSISFDVLAIQSMKYSVHKHVYTHTLLDF